MRKQLRPGIDPRSADHQFRYLRVEGPYFLAVPILQGYLLRLVQVDGTRLERRIILRHSGRTELGPHQPQIVQVGAFGHGHHHAAGHRVDHTAAHLAVHLEVPLYVLYGLNLPYIILIQAQLHVQWPRHIVRALQQIRVAAGTGAHGEFRETHMADVHGLLKIYRHLLRHRVYVRRAQLALGRQRRYVTDDARIRQVVLDATRHCQQQHRRYIQYISILHIRYGRRCRS